MENSSHSPHFYNKTLQAPNCDIGMDGLYDGLYGAQNELKSSCSLDDIALSKESRVPLSENYSSTQQYSYPGLHCPARLDWHQIGQPLDLWSKNNFAKDAWLKTRRVLAISDSDEDTESPEDERVTLQKEISELTTENDELLASLDLLQAQGSTPLPTTPTNSSQPFDITYTIPESESESESPSSSSTATCVLRSPPGSIATPSPLPELYRAVSNTLQNSAMAARKQNQAYLVLHAAIPVAAISLATTTVTGIYTTLEEANGFVERIAEETCRDVPEEHLTLMVEEDGGYAFDIFDMEKHMLHRVHIEKQVIRGAWSDEADFEKTGVMRRDQEEEREIFLDMAKLSL
ncbi:hypothetical protein SBOR_2043 [Sclerotinia borealis F-4128]|uniref:Uncharacterized protein n=1 Tax=Sclerotinia borealis (strain F-4128) TaxID=1432307 RepID=W9CNZ9_SCLBF|nr:hypothetical protein SBOR_2043 [Sclerotinia borealis F-4128]